MGCSVLYKVDCPSCGSKVMKWTGIRVPSLFKEAPDLEEVECDYILRCPECGGKLVLAELPAEPVPTGDGIQYSDV